MSGEQPPQDESKPSVGVVTNDEKNLVVSFIQFLRHKVSSGQCTDDQIEGLEVAVQCLETAFNVSDLSYAFQPSKPLLDIFVAAEGLSQSQEQFPTPTVAEVEQANKLKEEGNELVKAMKLDEAIQKYNEAIKLNRDPIYFCNRAAAYCRMEQYDLAIQDCRTALALDPNYAKAYGRMGVALSCQNRYDQAVEAYKKALEIDPNNESYKQNLGIAQDKFKEAEAAFANNPQANPMGGLPFSLGNILNNPQMMQMASQMMTDPNIQNMMSEMMNRFMGGAGGAQAGPGGQNLESFLRAGESMAQRMSEANPDLVEQLRRSFGGANGNPRDPNAPGGN
ncbi:tetratricopeptide repeat domain-containing protein [Ditylenchus destructor]|uniref:Tetratricopeptide repeat domain-containing protein n=1 Tax=Ditylenchus destructor TaxID=166010 RepID=A0AAD4R262_9BILA|nr:tetratricopeptide repeat domain-containing protein [Ditylenchus destructor]